MDIQWPSYDDDDGPNSDDYDPGDLYQFTPDGINTPTERGHTNHVIKCGIVVQGETDPRRVPFCRAGLTRWAAEFTFFLLKGFPHPSFSFRVLQ